MKEQTEALTKKIVKIIFAWEDEKEEKWLEEMAAQGWRLEHAAPYVYHFRKSQPEKVVIRLDYKNTLDKDYQEYLTLFHDAGWELVVTFANWHYFRINPQNNETPEIYNSNRAKAQKYRRLLIGLAPILIIFVTVFNPVFYRNSLQETGLLADFYGVASIVRLVLLVIMIYIFIRILAKIRKLESTNKE